MANSLIVFSIFLTFVLSINGKNVSDVKEHVIQKRTPFRNTEIMTARGFGKRESYDDKADPDSIDVGSEEVSTIKRNENPTPLFFPFYLNKQSQMTSKFAPQSSAVRQGVPLKYHRLQTRDMQTPLKFRLNDGLRISRGFGKRSQPTSDIVEYNVQKVLASLERLSSEVENLLKIYSNKNFCVIDGSDIDNDAAKLPMDPESIKF